MNTERTTFPELGQDRIDEIEQNLFARIAEERSAQRQSAHWQSAERARVRAVRRGRFWMGGAAAAALIAVAAVIAPQLTGGSRSASTTASVELPAMRAEGGPAADLGMTDGKSASMSGSGAADGAAGSGAQRQVATTASATVQVDDTAAAAQAVGAAAVAAGGYVESQSTGGASGTPVEPMTDSRVVVAQTPGAWVTVRVPADRLSDAVAGLSQYGTVTSSQVDRHDVTTETLDLQARVSALEASVARLTELMGQSTSTADLISAESALSQRQSELESLRQQLSWTQSQVQMSTLSVSLVEPAPTVAANPAGFGDGIGAGWNGLVATLNGLVVAIGFLLPWVAVVLVAAVVVWLVRRMLRRRTLRAKAPVDD